MHSINLLPTPTARLSRSGGRSYYLDEQGQQLPSVTSILNATKPLEARRSLARWKRRVGVDTAKQISTTASRRGTLTHKHLKDYLLGHPAPCPDSALPYWRSLETVLPHLSDVRLVEGTVFHYDLCYAGKVDCVASYQGIPCVLDWKTSDRPKGSVQRLYDNPLQIAAYCGAINHTYGDQGLRLTAAMIVVAIPDEDAEVFWFDAHDLKSHWQQWQARLREFYSNSRGC